ncbi:hemolysin family protein [Aequorivita lipolytica]|uniref:HlyC/CorC family transporter n=1 Tax=Aequorivita lipolytica TaxID=153267 RepID=A0A5C6YQ15_9FLAO|nr:hemolysin family protein [Aequorivita lipolytica]TXD69116.1 HlyC/CorC family transporter [Aequorivita lipolytica]SRX51311.1 Magnesium and cobalt efflux protein CorC [Aequorivita lipolytica]
MAILIIFLLILMNGIFAMSEIAMVSSRKSRLETAAKRGDKTAKKALELSQNPGKFLSTVQIGITLIGILTGIYSGEKIEDDLVNYLNNFGLLRQYSETIAVTIIVVTLTFFSLVLGELVPKRIGLTMPEKISKLLSFPMYYISVIAAPFIWLLTFTSDAIIKLFQIKPTLEGRVTEEEIKAIIQEGMEGGAIHEIEQDIMERVISMGDRKVASLMTHRFDTIFLRTTFNVKTINSTVNSEMHSVYPVLNKESGVEGIILLKDLFKHINKPKFKITDHLRQPQYFSENLSAYEALKLFKTGNTHQAIVIDEFGQMQGIVTMNDLLEALVGDVSDFYSSEFDFIHREDGSWLIDAQYPLTEFLRKIDLDDLAEDYPFNTISGLILNQLSRIPATGDTLLWLNFEIEIVDMDGARIDKVLLTDKNQ